MLFEPVEFKNLNLRNRIIWPPMVSWEADQDGFVTDKIVERYRRRAEGGASMLVVEATGINTSKSPFLLRIFDDKYLPGLKKLVDAIHAEGCKASVQLIHFLRASKSGWREQVEDLGPDAVKDLIKDFASAALRAKEAGFDAIELHAAHYYTLSSFLSRLNKREDEYGGPFKNRFRIFKEVYEACREKVGEDYCIGTRINGDEFVFGGSTLKQAIIVSENLAKLGINYISVSAGGKSEDGPWYTGYSGSRTMPPAYMPAAVNVYLAEAIRKAVERYDIPVITAGRIPTATLAEKILQEKQADLIGICRPLLADPDWPKKWQQNKIKDIINCKYCNDCLELDRQLKPVKCTERNAAGLE